MANIQFIDREGKPIREFSFKSPVVLFRTDQVPDVLKAESVVEASNFYQLEVMLAGQVAHLDLIPDEVLAVLVDTESQNDPVEILDKFTLYTRAGKVPVSVLQSSATDIPNSFV